MYLPSAPSGTPLVVAGTFVVGEVPGRPPGFVVRDELDDLAGLLKDRERVVVCAGGRGVGKSALAAEYARQQIEDAGGARVVVWLSGQSEVDLVTGLSVLAQRTNLARDDEDAQHAAARARDYLNGLTVPALLVVDNAEHPERLTHWLPGAGTCRVLLTSTDQAFTALAAGLQLGDFTRDQSLTYLSERTGLDDPDGAEQVADALGDLPLALAQAAGVITTRRLTFRQYLDRLTATALGPSLAAQPGYPRRLPEAVMLSVDAASTTHRHARAALDLLSVLAPTGVTRGLLADLLDHVIDGWTAADDADELVAALSRASLVTFTADATAVFMHRLVARTLRDSHPELTVLLTHVCKGLESALPSREVGPPLPTWSRTSPHRPCHCSAWPTTPRPHRRSWSMAASTATTIGVWLYDVGVYPAMITLDELALAARERVLGPDHPTPCTSRSNLAVGYRAVGRHDEAITLHEATLTARERVLGPDHPDTLNSRSNLAAGYRAVGRHDEAITLHEATLTDPGAGPRPRPPRHPDLPQQPRRRLPGGRPLRRGDHPARGDPHRPGSGSSAPTTPTPCTSRNNLAVGYRAVGRYDEAITLHEATLTARERVLGPDHPDTLHSRNNLAVGYRVVGRHDEAITLHEATLTTRERVLGPDHPDTLTSRNNLAVGYRAVGRHEDARRIRR